ncbi:hypothetical protein Cgig2_025602 [Carnegiea gigantea]|uniref:Uncharacterized protein n=1 Tax=Carnegiea gigantea TaxID=171969 RepID=A0A9Q1JVC5_9CARY|nr:hypothetical protein Cgig2_025602 [Carnegiea gigantea]
MLANKSDDIDNHVNICDSQKNIDSMASSSLSENHNSRYGSLSPFSKSPWTMQVAPTACSNENGDNSPISGDVTYNHLMGSLVREEGHIYSLAASGDLLYTGSDSKNIRVWKNQKEFYGFKCSSGLVKSIVISADKMIFTGHQDGKIRVWKMSTKSPTIHKKVGTMPTIKAFIKKSIKPRNYVEIGRNRNVVWIRHFDAISSLSLSEDHNFLYSASWDRTVKVWRTSNFKCLESIPAHDDAVNVVVSGFDGLVFTGSADGTIKVWSRELQGKRTKHLFSRSLLKQDCAVTALVIDPSSTMVYSGSSNGLVNFWRRDDLNTYGGVLEGHRLAILCLATSGSLVFSGHYGPVKCLAVEANRETKSYDRKWILYSGSLDKSVKMWRISEEASPEPGITQCR